MRSPTVRRPSPALLISLVALVAALAGSAYAAGKIGTKQIRNGAVTTKKLGGGAVTAKKLANRSVATKKIRAGAVTAPKLRDGAVDASKVAADAATGEKVDEASLGAVPSVRGAKRIARTSIAPSADGATPAAARSAASKIPLAGEPPLTLYAKCFRVGAGTVHAEAFIDLGVPDVAFTSANAGGSNNVFFGPSSPEVDRMAAHAQETGPNGVDTNAPWQSGFLAVHSGGFLAGNVYVSAKRGEPAGSQAIGSGDRCLFTGAAWSGAGS